MMTAAEQMDAISPIIAVRDLPASIDFYTQVLGFEVRALAPENNYGLVVREGVGVCLIGGADENAAKATGEHCAAYIWVKDLDGLWSELETKLLSLPEGRVRAPFMQDYGMREFHVKDPDGFLMFFGENAEKVQ